MAKYTFTVKTVERSLAARAHEETFSSITPRYISEGMAHKCAMSGLNLHHLKQIHTEKGIDGVHQVLSEPLEDTKLARVSRKLCVAKKLCKAFE